MTTALLVTYWCAVTGLFVYGINCYVLCRKFFEHQDRERERRAAVRAAHARNPSVPAVTVQLPLYNERYVARRLLEAVAAMDYPRDRLQIQVLDDSTDDTTARVAECVTRLRSDGVDIEHIRRTRRDGYKAGALRDGMLDARGEFIAIFDADFIPPPDFLTATLPFFDPPQALRRQAPRRGREHHGIGLVQARWGHVNREYSWLTRVQALAIDGHFGIEQPGRCWAGYLLNFNGTAGIWRRKAIEAAGGWQADTLTEDLDLSYRAQLAGWSIEYLPDVEVPAEIPTDITAFKSQQRRWAKGSIQTARKLLPRVLRTKLPLVDKFQACVHLTHYLVHPLMLAVALLAVPVLWLWQGAFGASAFAIMALMLALGTCGPSTLYISSQRVLRTNWRRTLLTLPLLMLIGTGIAVSNTRAVAEALLGVPSGFVRTPKRNVVTQRSGSSGGGYRLPVDSLFVLEASLALYAGWGLALYLERDKYLIGPFLALYAVGFACVAVLSIRDTLARRAGDEPGA